MKRISFSYLFAENNYFTKLNCLLDTKSGEQLYKRGYKNLYIDGDKSLFGELPNPQNLIKLYIL